MPSIKHNTALYGGRGGYSTSQWTDGGRKRKRKETELPGKANSTAPPGNNTTSDICAMIYSAHRGEKKGGGGSQMTLAQLPKKERKKDIQFWAPASKKRTHGLADACQLSGTWLRGPGAPGAHTPRLSHYSGHSVSSVSHSPLSGSRYRVEQIIGMIQMKPFHIHSDCRVIANKTEQVAAKISRWLHGANSASTNCVWFFMHFIQKIFGLWFLLTLPFIYHITLFADGLKMISDPSNLRIHNSFVSKTNR